MESNKKAFTLIELLVVIAIIGMLATISVIALSNARSKSRDAKRAGDMKQVQTALELFFNDNNRYPTVEEWATGRIGAAVSGVTSTYMQIIPTAPTPADGNCEDGQNTISYAPLEDGNSYSISFCLGNTTGSLTPGPKCLTPGGIVDVDCSGTEDQEFACGDSVSYGNYSYSTVLIGDQCWFSENLRTTTYNDGTNINNITDATSWSNDTAGAYCWYENNYAIYGSIYGALYNYYAVNTGNLCPDGWSVPSYAEMIILVNAVGGNSVAGSALKEAGNNHWSENADATNSSGFIALGSGMRWWDEDYNYYWIGIHSDFWSSDAHTLSLSCLDSDINFYTPDQARGLSVRCLQD